MDEKWDTDDFESGSSANSDTPARRSVSVYHLRLEAGVAEVPVPV
jgi:hypothetical protein